ncbi:ABC transporter ATP-binding protein [Staphylococcus canis]|uniref:ABC transporter ATP-binding protein n=1 Tax=Staphylococcus canis TaxID=2724942 RepID=A0ABS0T6B7_9STAP|nr:ABC transporter ATP-binding protein [Staphylococcus canis]MBI5974283.1 ABC transporter ATP-binding protein [Staphylococcus canis]
MVLRVDAVTKRFNQFEAVKHISFTLEKGRMLGFLGRNGAGKTTTFRMILGLIEPSEGTITFDGQPIKASRYNHIGYLPEERGLHPKLTVFEELKYLATLKGVSSKDLDKTITYWLERFQITENKDKKIESLSKGNQQKIQLLASIIHEPELIILDEPFSGLDPVNVELLKSAIVELNQKGATIIFSSHRMEHIEELCDDVCILNKGEMVVQGEIHEVKSKYGYKRVAIDAHYDVSEIESLDGIRQVEKINTTTYFTIENESVAEVIFQVIRDKGFVKRFEVVEPTIKEIFIQEVGELHA